MPSLCGLTVVTGAICITLCSRLPAAPSGEAGPAEPVVGVPSSDISVVVKYITPLTTCDCGPIEVSRLWRQRWCPSGVQGEERVIRESVDGAIHCHR